MRGKITKRTVDAMTTGEDGAERVLWDGELKGFGVRVQRGGAKSYVLHYRVGCGRGAPLRKLTIGRHGSPWTPDTARREAKRLLGLSRTALTRQPKGSPVRKRQQSSSLPNAFSPNMPTRSVRLARQLNTSGCSTRSSCRRSVSGRRRT